MTYSEVSDSAEEWKGLAFDLVRVLLIVPGIDRDDLGVQLPRGSAATLNEVILILESGGIIQRTAHGTSYSLRLKSSEQNSRASHLSRIHQL
jgi:hypothetical protein